MGGAKVLMQQRKTAHNNTSRQWCQTAALLMVEKQFCSGDHPPY